MQKANPNDPCPCGSGKKYKYCHGSVGVRQLELPTPVLYIHPAKQGVDFPSEPTEYTVGRPYGLIPMGIPALVNSLREQGIRVKGINYPMERKFDPVFDLRRWVLQHEGVRVILIDLHWYEHCYGAISVAEACKEILPQVWVIVGGLTASAYAGEILADFPAVDFVIRGDAEYSLLPLVQRLLARERAAALPDLGDIPNLSYRLDGQVVETVRSYCAAPEDLARLNFMDIDFMEHEDSYYVHEYLVVDMEVARRAAAGADVGRYRGRWLCTARGCDFNCSYCGGAKSVHKALAGRDGIVPCPVERIVEQTRYLHDAKQVIQVAFSYDIAEMGESYWRKLFALLRKESFKIGLYNEFFQLPPRGFIKDYVRTADMEHSCIALNPYSGSERVRRFNGKRYNDAELFNALDELNLYNIPIFVYFSLNLPGEDEQTIEETIALADRIYHHYPHSLLKILNSCHTVEPLSPMLQSPEKYGITVSMSTFTDFYAYCRETQLAKPGARTGEWRGFATVGPPERSLQVMADKWDAACRGREASMWPIPPSW
ncbi:MAG TPA: radical SAM protein [Anaerolineae bacterium]|nr:radical SAM protein [Anaerolineae bacterium]